MSRWYPINTIEIAPEDFSGEIDDIIAKLEAIRDTIYWEGLIRPEIKLENSDPLSFSLWALKEDK